MNLTISQKKILGIVLIFIFIPIELILLAVFVNSVITNGGAVTQNEISFFFTMGLFCFPVWFGLRLWKAGTHSSANVPDINNSTIDTHTRQLSDFLIKIQVKIEPSEFRKLIFLQTYTNPAVIFIHFIGSSMLLFSLLNGTTNWFLLFILLFILCMPVLIYRSAASTYKTTKALHEDQVFEFTSENIIATGQSFNYTIQWRSLHKVKETKNWFLLYTNKQSAMFIPKSSFVSHSDLETFSHMTHSLQTK